MHCEGTDSSVWRRRRQAEPRPDGETSRGKYKLFVRNIKDEHEKKCGYGSDDVSGPGFC